MVSLSPAIKKHAQVLRLVEPSVWQNYKDFDMMEEEDIYEIRELNNVLREITKLVKNSPLSEKEVKKCLKKQAKELNDSKKRRRALSKLLVE
jgi:pyruvate/2-oxoacid:ferredoxin oxidoreductase beta subunit